MKAKKQNYLRIILAILLVSGLIYAFYNIVSIKIEGHSNMRRMGEVSTTLLKSIHYADRMECDSLVYLQLEEGYLQDPTGDLSVIQDFKNHRFAVHKGERQLLFEYEKGDLCVYSKGISPIYNKKHVSLESVPLDRWVHYSTEEMFGENLRKGENARLSYGFLTNKDYLIHVHDEKQVKIEDEIFHKYKVVLYNTLKNPSVEESDRQFRKTIRAYGLDALEMKREYPEIYKKMRDKFNADTEEMYVWLDKEGNLAKLEKDYTFPYYLDVLKGNSETVYNKVGQYGYPDVVCQQQYSYNPTCGRIDMPVDFEEL